jgi:hypothetical protein
MIVFDVLNAKEPNAETLKLQRPIGEGDQDLEKMSV